MRKDNIIMIRKMALSEICRGLKIYAAVLICMLCGIVSTNISAAEEKTDLSEYTSNDFTRSQAQVQLHLVKQDSFVYTTPDGTATLYYEDDWWYGTICYMIELLEGDYSYKGICAGVSVDVAMQTVEENTSYIQYADTADESGNRCILYVSESADCAIELVSYEGTLVDKIYITIDDMSSVSDYMNLYNTYEDSTSLSDDGFAENWYELYPKFCGTNGTSEEEYIWFSCLEDADGNTIIRVFFDEGDISFDVLAYEYIYESTGYAAGGYRYEAMYGMGDSLLYYPDADGGYITIEIDGSDEELWYKADTDSYNVNASDTTSSEEEIIVIGANDEYSKENTDTETETENVISQNADTDISEYIGYFSASKRELTVEFGAYCSGTYNDGMLGGEIYETEDGEVCWYFNSFTWIQYVYVNFSENTRYHYLGLTYGSSVDAVDTTVTNETSYSLKYDVYKNGNRSRVYMTGDYDYALEFIFNNGTRLVGITVYNTTEPAGEIIDAAQACLEWDDSYIVVVSDSDENEFQWDWYETYNVFTDGQFIIRLYFVEKVDDASSYSGQSGILVEMDGEILFYFGPNDCENYGDGGYYYAGDSEKEYLIWYPASKKILVCFDKETEYSMIYTEVSSLYTEDGFTEVWYAVYTEFHGTIGTPEDEFITFWSYDDSDGNTILSVFFEDDSAVEFLVKDYVYVESGEAAGGYQYEDPYGMGWILVYYPDADGGYVYLKDSDTGETYWYKAG